MVKSSMFEYVIEDEHNEMKIMNEKQNKQEEKIKHRWKPLKIYID